MKAPIQKKAQFQGQAQDSQDLNNPFHTAHSECILNISNI